ncbi:MAG: hypothetical protein AAB373_01240 [Patescibacteria group bacterium]
MAKMVKVTVDLPDEMYESIKSEAKKHNTSMSGYVREFVLNKEMRRLGVPISK